MKLRRSPSPLVRTAEEQSAPHRRRSGEACEPEEVMASRLRTAPWRAERSG